MKLVEAKEKLPIDFITNIISKNWDEVGILQASIKAISKEFKDTKEAEEILQDLIDAYLISLGRLEGLLKDDKDLVKPENITPIVEAQEDNKLITENFILEDSKKELEESFEYICDFAEPEISAEDKQIFNSWIGR